MVYGYNWREAITYIIKDPKWISTVFFLGLCMLLWWLLFPVFVFRGYIIRTIRHVADGNISLPSLSNSGEMVEKGFKMFLVDLAYMWPGYLLTFISMIFSFGFIALIASSEPSALAIMLVMFGSLLQMIGSLLLIVIIPFTWTALLWFTATNSMKACFRPKLMWQFFKKYFKDFVIIYVINIAVGYIASLGMFLFFIGYAFTLAYATLVSAYLYGKLLEKSRTDIPPVQSLAS
jgi:hypothetical protein